MTKKPKNSIAWEVAIVRDKAKYVTQVRKDTGTTMQELANMIGVHHSTIYLWETGKRPVPKPAMIAMETYRRGLLHLTPSTESV
jgi:DNA-binding XRE family transcriptional regulator